MTRARLPQHETPVWNIRQRRLAVAVMAAIPLLVQAQPLLIDPRLLGQPAAPAPAGSAPAASGKPAPAASA
ncbi:MAG: hypothetical protein REI09_15310, partial [Candidatus Dactylopiibacterium sp.]|nr:hypothetical protein [Candidatus Dactylopiibacterium sp.]